MIFSFQFRQRSISFGAALAILCPAGALLATASPYIDIRISVKVIEYDGEHNPSTSADFDSLLAQANRVLLNHQRGYRFVNAGFQIITPNVPAPSRYFSRVDGSPVPSPTPGDPDPPSSQFKVQPVSLYKFWNSTHQTDHSCWQPPDNLMADDRTHIINVFSVLVDDIFKKAILDNRSAFQYDTVNANLYVIWGNYCGGEGTYPRDSLSNPDHTDTNIYHVSSLGDVALFLHEFGHYVDLQHPFATADLQIDKIGTENPDFPDTPPDVWSVTVPSPISSTANGDALAQRMYGRNYSQLTAGQQTQVQIMDKTAQLRPFNGNYSAAQIDELWITWENIMSYHKGQDLNMDNWLYSEQQLDHDTDIMNTVRNPIVSGHTWFTASSGKNSADGMPNGSNSPPYNNDTLPGQRYGMPYNLPLSVTSANSAGGDVILMRKSDTFANPITITKPVTLRVSRGGHATIGSSTAH